MEGREILHYEERLERQARDDNSDIALVRFERSVDFRRSHIAQRTGDDLAKTNPAVKRVEVVAPIAFVQAKPIPQFLFVVPVTELCKK